MLVEHDDRRWVCYEVNDKYCGPNTPESKAYFDRLLSIDVRHFAYFLYNRDISQFNPREIPPTDYQRFQKRLNFDSSYGWIEKSLQEGKFNFEYQHNNFSPHNQLTSPDIWMQSGGIMTRASLLASHKFHISQLNQKYQQIAQDGAVFTNLYKTTNATGKEGNIKRGPRGEQELCVMFPPLEQCRVAFAAAMHDSHWEWHSLD